MESKANPTLRHKQGSLGTRRCSTLQCGTGAKLLAVRPSLIIAWFLSELESVSLIWCFCWMEWSAPYHSALLQIFDPSSVCRVPKVEWVSGARKFGDVAAILGWGLRWVQSLCVLSCCASKPSRPGVTSCGKSTSLAIPWAARVATKFFSGLLPA